MARRPRVLVVVLVVAGMALLAAQHREQPGRGKAGGGAESSLALGAAVQLPALIVDQRYRHLVQSHFDTVTPENEMKWSIVHPRPDLYQFGPADTIVDFAEEHGMRVRGHTLVWYRQNPAWLTDTPFTRDQMIALLRDHIATVVGRYRGRVFQWDVVNEAVADDGTLRDNVWLRAIGPDYIALAFRFAHEADPSARLFYNEFDAEAPGPKAEAVHGLVRTLQAEGVPVHGVGLQLHTTLSPPRPRAVAETMRQLAQLGLEVAVTEIDVRLRLPPTKEDLRRQARVYRSMMSTCRAAPNCTAYVSWGVTDRYSWIPFSYPGYGAALPFDSSYRPKPAFEAFRRRRLTEKPRTNRPGCRRAGRR